MNMKNVEYNEITKPAIQEAVKEINIDRVNAHSNRMLIVV